ncbi:trafficking protein particle complex subunit 6B-like isoform X2 [Varroa jacobsoni]|uniref:Trafficking protein particle complex subunit 6B n=1 Tax=Varroa destructor TaxID=109461 RepID=A0A7M7KIE7_VARDE|nr:trafficking protein particle complex subunit 6B-like isoform X2 [Varroa destructor]XP_022711710.1 trafficking protein particle complex subunit 6B-like isoform X2 [Varroa jacobsoni]
MKCSTSRLANTCLARPSSPEAVLFELLYSQLPRCFAAGNNSSDNNSGDNLNTKVSKLEQIGFETGYRLVERLTKDCPRFKSELDIVKFICTEFWSALFKKQVDNLRTNYQGVYVLQDLRFRFLAAMSSSKQYMESTPCYLAFPCGLIRGALSNLGVTSVVTVEVTELPSCKFQIQAQPS